MLTRKLAFLPKEEKIVSQGIRGEHNLAIWVLDPGHWTGLNWSTILVKFHKRRDVGAMLQVQLVSSQSVQDGNS